MKNELIAIWKQLANQRKIQNYDVAAYCIVKAIFAKSNEKYEVAKALLLKSFTPITNDNKLNNGHAEWGGLEQALIWASRSKLYIELDKDSQKIFASLQNSLVREEWQDKTYAYILVRQDLPKIQQVVQAAHVAMVLGQQVPKFEADARKQHFCILALDDNKDLLKELARANRKKLPIARFFESDIGQYTALAYHPMRKSFAQRKKLFESRKLLTID
jgi:hypothetical protein